MIAYIAGQRYRTRSEGLESVGSVACLHGNGKRTRPNAMCHLHRRVRTHRYPGNTSCKLRFRLSDRRIDGRHWSASLADGKLPILIPSTMLINSQITLSTTSVSCFHNGSSQDSSSSRGSSCLRLHVSLPLFHPDTQLTVRVLLPKRQ